MINSLNSLLPWHWGLACPACLCPFLWLPTPYPCPRTPGQLPEHSKGCTQCLGLPWCLQCSVPGWGGGMGSGCQAVSWQSHGELPQALTVPFSSRSNLHGAVAVCLKKQTKCLRHLLMILSSPVLWMGKALHSEPPNPCLWALSGMFQNAAGTFAGKAHVKPFYNWLSLFLSNGGLHFNNPQLFSKNNS